MELINALKVKKPKYSTVYEETVLQFTAKQGGQDGRMGDATISEFGKTFKTKYQMFIYASILGIHRKEKIEISDNEEGKDFMEIKGWQPSDVVDYLLMMVMMRDNMDLVKLASLDEDRLKIEANNIIKSLEGYANGGLEFIKSRFEDHPEDFRSNYWYIDLMNEVIPEEKTDNIVNEQGSSDEVIA